MDGGWRRARANTGNKQRTDMRNNGEGQEEAVMQQHDERTSSRKVHRGRSGRDPQHWSCGGVFLQARRTRKVSVLQWLWKSMSNRPLDIPSTKSPGRPRHWEILASLGDLIWDKEAYKTNEVSHPHPFILSASFFLHSIILCLFQLHIILHQFTKHRYGNNPCICHQS